MTIHYNPEVVEKILAGLRRGLSVRAICREDGMPAFTTVFDWLADARYGAFVEAYKKARFAGCEAIADELFDIADDGRNDWVERHNKRSGLTEKVLDHEHVLRSKLRVEARKWYLSKIVPKIYGDRVEVDHKGNIDLIARLTEGRQRALGVESSQLVVDGGSNEPR